MSGRAIVHTACLLLFIAAPLWSCAQQPIPVEGPPRVDIAPQSDQFPLRWYPPQTNETKEGLAPTLDAPYTATIETAIPYNTPSDDVRQFITYGFQARDRFGRTRQESVNGEMTFANRTEKTKQISVADPVSHCAFHWIESVSGVELPGAERVAFVTCDPQKIVYRALDLYRSLRDHSLDGTRTYGDTSTTTEHLAPVQVDGLSVDRIRISSTSKDERGEVRHWSTETWFSPDLNEIIRRDLEPGHYEQLIHLHRVDPDPKLFYPPVGFRIEVEPARPRAAS